jgi:hypothetical protein
MNNSAAQQQRTCVKNLEHSAKHCGVYIHSLLREIQAFLLGFPHELLNAEKYVSNASIWRQTAINSNTEILEKAGPPRIYYPITVGQHSCVESSSSQMRRRRFENSEFSKKTAAPDASSLLA